jgi:uncharacterized protein
MKILKPIAAAALSAVALLSAADSASQWKSDELAWRTHREERLALPDSWLTLVGLEWLKPGTNTIGSAPDNRIHLAAPAPAHFAVVEVKGDEVTLQPPASGFASGVQVDGGAAHPTRLADDSAPKPTVVTAGTLSFYVIHRGDRYALRLKDSQASTRVSFHGLHWYDLDPHYVVQARWIPFNPPHQLKIPSIIGTTDLMPAPGEVEFTLDGQTLRVEPVLEEPDAKQLFFILRDTTSRSTSYGAARFLYTGFPDHGLTQPGQLTLDFNHLQNPPCAYTPYATCPLPPEQNRLAIALPVGEKKYSH